MILEISETTPNKFLIQNWQGRVAPANSRLLEGISGLLLTLKVGISLIFRLFLAFFNEFQRLISDDPDLISTQNCNDTKIFSSTFTLQNLRFWIWFKICWRKQNYLTAIWLFLCIFPIKVVPGELWAKNQKKNFDAKRQNNCFTLCFTL